MKPWTKTLILVSLAGPVGCGGAASAPSRPPGAPIPLAIHRPEGGMRVFSGEDETTSTSSFPFEGATGSVRVMMEVVTNNGVSGGPVDRADHEVVFRAVGDGRIAIAFRKPFPGHPQGRVTIRCQSVGEESDAEFEPNLWMSLPSSIVTFESPPNEPANPIVEGREVVLGRYVARNIPSDIRLTLKAVFTREPVTSRAKGR